MRSEDIATVGKQVVETIEQSVAEDIKNSLLVTQLLEVNNRFRKAIEPNNEEEKAAINEMFANRKQCFNNLYFINSGYKGSNDAAVKAAATTVSYVLNMYGGLSFGNLSRTANTQRYTTIVETLNKPEYTEAIVKLNIRGLINELADANTAYETMYKARGNKRSMRIPSGEMRTEMNNALKAVTDEVRLFALKYPTEANKELQNNVLQRITEVYVPAPGYTKLADTSTEGTNPDSSTEVI